MSEPLILNSEQSVEKLSARFTAMAERMVLNKASSFGGAFVIIPPAEGGEPIETLILDSKQDAAQFWALLKTKAEMQLAGLDQLARQQSAFTRR